MNKLLDSLHKKILKSKFAEEVTEAEIDALVEAKEYNGGWIPCSDKLPEIDGNTSDVVLVCTFDGFQHMAFWCDDEKWRYCESGMIKNTMVWTEILAWQPLPAPYQPKGEQLWQSVNIQMKYVQI